MVLNSEDGSYRSTPEITELFASLLDEGIRIDISSVQREGEAPLVQAVPAEEYAARLKGAMDTARQRIAGSKGLCAVICADAKSARKLAATLGEDAPAVITNGGQLPSEGVVMLPLELAKGLEFDQVIIPDADGHRYPDNPLSRRRLYTGISRATKHVTVLACDQLSPLLGQLKAKLDALPGGSKPTQYAPPVFAFDNFAKTLRMANYALDFRRLVR